MRSRLARRQNPITFFFSKSKLFPLLGLVLVVLIVYPLVKKIKHDQALNREIQELEMAAEKIKGKNEDLEKVIDFLESSSFVEAKARNDFDMKMSGEKVVIIKDSKNSQPAEKDSSVFIIEGFDKTPPTPAKTNPEKWLEYFFKINSD